MKNKTLFGFPIKEVDGISMETDSIKLGGPLVDTKIVAVGDIVGKTYEPSIIMNYIEKGVNEILKKTNGRLRTIKINSSLHMRDYDALTIRIVGRV